MSPYAATWLALQTPHVLLVAAWIGTLPRARAAVPSALGIAGLVGWLGIGGAEVLDGGVPTDGSVWPVQVRWAVLGLALGMAAPRRRFHVVSAGFAGAAAFVGAWIPAVVLLGRGAMEGAPRAVQAGLAAFLWAGWARAHAFLWVASLFGPLGLGIDATTIVAASALGTVEAVGWALMFARAPGATAPRR